MAAPAWWDAVRREVRDILVPGLSKRMGASPDGGSPSLSNAARRQEGTEGLPTAVLPTAIDASTAPTLTLADTSLALAPTSTTASSTSQADVQTPTTSVPSPSSSAEASGNGSGGLSTGATAGIVIGALAGLLAVFVVLYLVFSMRKKKLARQRQQMEDDEKINGPFADSAAVHNSSPNKAPRLSLRPVTQFLPNFGSQGHAERRASRGIALTLNPVSNPPLNRPNGGSAWERPTVGSTAASPYGEHSRPDTSTSLHPNNPFHDKNRLPDLPDEPVSPISSMGSFDHRVGMATTTDSIPEPVSPILGDDDDHHQHHNQPGSNLTRKTSMRNHLPKPLDLTKPPSPLYAVPPSPTGTEYSMQSMAPGQSPGPSFSAEAIAAAGGPSQSTVHRVQLDFKPTLQDEMELRAGQLVRLLHEYDDGWALCIRLDRSQQGVVPRTCLSTRPVKPRPNGPGPGPGPVSNPRGGPPVNPSFHFGHGPSHGRPASPGGFPPVPVKDERYGGGYGGNGGNGGYGYGRPRSPGGGFGGRGPSPSGWRGGNRSPGGSGSGDGSPAPGQAY